MLVRCAGREFSVPRRMIGRRARFVLSADGVLRVEKANFPYVKTLADFDFSSQPSI